MNTKYAAFNWPSDVELPKSLPRSATHVATVAWDWAPTNSRQDAYHLSTNRKRSHWVLWVGCFDDDDTSAWQHMPYAYGPKAGVDAFTAARELLRAGWKGEVEASGSPDHFHEVTSDGLLTEDDLMQIGIAVWGEDAGVA